MLPPLGLSLAARVAAQAWLLDRRLCLASGAARISKCCYGVSVRSKKIGAIGAAVWACKPDHDALAGVNKGKGSAVAQQNPSQDRPRRLPPTPINSV